MVYSAGSKLGNMLYDAQSITVLSQKLWIWLPPGLALLITVLSINFLGDGIRDALGSTEINCNVSGSWKVLMQDGHPLT